MLPVNDDRGGQADPRYPDTTPAGHGTTTGNDGDDFFAPDVTPQADKPRPIPVVYGVAPCIPSIVYAKQGATTIKAYKPGQGGTYDTTCWKAVLAISEGTIQGLGETEAGAAPVRIGGGTFQAGGGLTHLCAVHVRTCTATAGGNTITWSSDQPIQLKDWRNAYIRRASGADVQFRAIASTSGPDAQTPQLVNSVTVTGTIPTAVGEDYIIEGGYYLHLSETPAAALPWLGTWNPGTHAFEGSEVGTGFGGTAFFATETLPLTESGTPPTIEFLVRGKCIVGGSTDPNVGNPYDNANPADVVLDILTNPRFEVRLQASDIDVAAYETYCAAQGFLVSRAITSQDSAASLISSLMICTNSVLVKTGGKIKVVPRAEYDGATATVLDDNEIIADPGRDPVEVRRVSDGDVYNCIPVEIQNRYSDFQPGIYETEDAAHVQQYGLRRGKLARLDWIKEPVIARRLSSILTQRSVYVRNFYTLRIKPRWALLEPMDFVAISHTAMGLSNVIARIVSMRRLPEGLIEIQCEESSPGAATPVDLTPPPHDGFDSVAPAPVYVGDATNALNYLLTSYGVTLPTTLTGGNYVVSSYTGASTELRVFIGSNDDSANWTVTKTDTNVTSSVSGRTVTVSAMSDTADIGYVDITATKTDFPDIHVRYTVTKAKQGATGAGGGSRGAGWYYASSTAGTATWSDTDANTATPGDNIFQDRVTIYNNNATPPWSMTKFWDGAAWQTMTVYIDGNLLVTGTVAGDKIAANAVGAKHLAVGDLTNLVANPSGNVGGNTPGTGGWSGMEDAGKAAVFSATSEFYLYKTSRDAWAGEWFTVTPGDQFWCSFTSQPQGGGTPDHNTAVGLHFRCTDPNDSALETYLGGATRLTSESGVQTKSGSVTVPDGRYWARVWVLYDHNTTGAGYFYKDIQIRRKAKGPVLVVDGTAVFGSGYDPTTKLEPGDVGDLAYLNEVGNANITTIDGGKITTGTIDAARINAISITAASLTISGQTINNAWFASTAVAVVGGLTWDGAAWDYYAPGFATVGSWNDTNKTLRIVATGAATKGFGDIGIATARKDNKSSGVYELRSVAGGTSGNDLYVDVQLWRHYYDHTLGDGGWTSEVVDWNSMTGAAAPWFDVTVTIYGATGVWRSA